MRALGGYAFVSLVAVAALALGLRPVLDADGDRGVLVGALIAWPVQVGSFGAMLALRRRRNAWMAAWLGGSVLRFAAVLVTAVVLIRTESGLLTPALLALVGFLFGLLLLEPVFWKRHARGTRD